VFTAVDGSTVMYDVVSNVTSLIDPINNRPTFASCVLDRLTSTTDRLGRRCDFGDDAGNRLTNETWVNVGGSTPTCRPSPTTPTATGR
jgi:hypothetical protein